MSGSAWTIEELELLDRILAGELSAAEREQLLQDVQTGRGAIAAEVRRLENADRSPLATIERILRDRSAPGGSMMAMETHQESPSVRVRLAEYLRRSADELLAAIQGAIPGDLVGVRSSSGLQAHVDELRQLICHEWDWPRRRNEPELQDPLARADAVCQLIVNSSLRLPFPAELAAAYLVKEGLDKLCD